MVKDGEAHAEEDKKFSELVAVRNNADAIIHSSEKNLKEMGDKVTSINRAKIESAISELKEVLQKDDKNIIEAKINNLNNISAEVLAQSKKNEEADKNTKDNEKGSESNNKSSGKPDGNVVDAEFEEVKEDKK
jgi:molecular chaperone DnaK